jgi:hypothetical protein
MGIGTPGMSGSFPALAENSIIQPLSTNGDGTGAISQNVNGSVIPVLFYAQPEIDEKYILTRMTVEAIDGNWSNASHYGALGAALPNGIKIYKRNDDGIIKDYTEFFTIKRTHDWALLAGVDSVAVGGSGEDPLMVRWTFERSGSKIELDGSKNERLVVEIPDDLTGLTDQICVIHGTKKAA